VAIAQECHIPGYDDPKIDVLPLVKAWLEGKEHGHWLMVIDNADDTQVFFGSQEPENASAPSRGNLGRYIPECAHGSILVTTRNKQTGVRLAKGQEIIEVAKMDNDESGQLVRTKLDGLELADSEILLLSSRLEYLPLALVQAAAFIRENTITVSKYLRLLQESDHNLVKLLSKEFQTVGRDSETPHAVTATWIISFEQIARQNTFASELLSIMSFFDRQAIPMTFLSHYNERQQDENQGNKLEELEARGVIELEEALGILKAFSFVSVAKDESLNMHRLVHLVTRKWLVNKGTMNQFARQALLTVSEVYPFGTYENWAICSEYLPHVYAVLKYEGTGSRAESVAKGTLLHCTAGLFLSREQWKEAERLQLQAIETRKEVLGEEHPDMLASMGDLALIYSKQGWWEKAELLNIQVIEKKKSVLGEEHPSTLASMGNLALTYSNQGRWREAESLEVQLMETRKRTLGEEHPDTLTGIANLAATLLNQGQWKEAESLEIQVIEMRKRALGEEHYDTLTSIGNLASTYSNQGRWREAESLEIQLMETRKRTLGEEHPATLTSIANLASTYMNQGRWKEAERLQLQAVETRKRILGEEHPDTLINMANLASTYNNQGLWREAESLLLQVTETLKRVLGKEHPTTLISMAHLASTYSNQCRWREAESLEVQLMETKKRVLGEEHPSTLASMNNLAWIWKGEDRHGDAAALMENCLQLLQRIFGPDHPHTVSARSALSEWNEERRNDDVD
jgi:tetratricopeptide (TPR) repeat protein